MVVPCYLGADGYCRPHHPAHCCFAMLGTIEGRYCRTQLTRFGTPTPIAILELLNSRPNAAQCVDHVERSVLDDARDDDHRFLLSIAQPEANLSVQHTSECEDGSREHAAPNRRFWQPLNPSVISVM